MKQGSHAPGARIGPFELIRILGRGGMGEVWLARQADGRVERAVALKLPALHQQAEVLAERFRRERDFLAKLEHPNIARLYDAGVTPGGQPWLAMEYVEGLSLAEHVASHALSIAQRLVLLRQVLAAVAHAHRHLVVHRDLKPANILVDASGQVKLLDFGIAKLIDAGEEGADERDLSRLGERLMTLRYAAPEQVAAGTITTATDIYSLGVILHELVTGNSPYRAVRDGKPLTESVLLIQDPAMPSNLAPGNLARLVSGDLDAIVLKAMRRDPRDRYASVELFDEDIQRHLERRPVKARAGTWRYLAGRFAVRHKLPLALTAAVLVTLGAALVTAEVERRIAVAQKARAERHFASVRKLANAFIFDVHGEIESIPGSLKAREMLVKTSLEYLDALVGEAGGDAALMYELAAAYRRIGNIVGEVGTASRGNLGMAIGNYEKALRLLEERDRVRPNDIDAVREHRDVSYALHRALFQNADARWRAQISATVALAQRVASLPGASIADRAFVPLAMSDRAQITSLVTGRNAEVEDEAIRAIALLEALEREVPGNVVVRRNLANVYSRAGSILIGKGRTPASSRQAVGYRRLSLAIRRELAAQDPADTRLREVELGNVIYLANALFLAGELREADRTIEEALRLGASLRAHDPDPNNTEPGIRMLTALAQAAETAYGLGDHARAIRRGREALALAASLPPGTQQSRDLRDDVTWTKATLGLALLAQAMHGSQVPEARLAILREARAFLAERMAFFGEAGASGFGAYDETEVGGVRDALAKAEAGIARVKQ
jgi:eukaryotic-like serine/threonine-protein kinase